MDVWPDLGDDGIVTPRDIFVDVDGVGAFGKLRIIIILIANVDEDDGRRRLTLGHGALVHGLDRQIVALRRFAIERQSGADDARFCVNAEGFVGPERIDDAVVQLSVGAAVLVRGAHRQYRRTDRRRFAHRRLVHVLFELRRVVVEILHVNLHRRRSAVGTAANTPKLSSIRQTLFLIIELFYVFSEFIWYLIAIHW